MGLRTVTEVKGRHLIEVSCSPIPAGYLFAIKEGWEGVSVEPVKGQLFRSGFFKHFLGIILAMCSSSLPQRLEVRHINGPIQLFGAERSSNCMPLAAGGRGTTGDRMNYET